MKLLILLFIIILLVIMGLCLHVNKNPKTLKEKYLPLSDDVAINVLLPTLDLQDLIKLSKTDESSKDVINKFIKQYLKLEGADLCSLMSTTYTTKIMPEIKKVVYPPLRNNSKPYFDLDFFKNWSMDLLYNSFKNLDPALNFLKKVDNEWLIYDDFTNLDKNVIMDRVRSKKNQDIKNLSYYVQLEIDYYGFIELKVYIKNGVLPELHSYFTDKVNEVRMWKTTKTLPEGYFWENIFVDFQEQLESPIEQDITEMEEGTLYTFMIFLSVFSSLNGYDKYLEYLESREERKEMERELDEIFDDSDEEKEA